MIRLDTSVTNTPATSPEVSPYEDKSMPFSRSRRQPSAELLLPGLLSPGKGKAPVRRTRWMRLALVGAVLCTVAVLAREPKVTEKVAEVWSSCEGRGMLSPQSNTTMHEDAHRLVVRLHPPSSSPPSDVAIPENTRQERPLHPFLTTQRDDLFNPKAPAFDVPKQDVGSCIRPESIAVNLKPRPVVRGDKQPELFFALCTAPDRATTYSSIWTHYMLAPDAQSPPPGCLVTDAAGTGDTAGMAHANDEFRRNGLGCVMRDSSRTGQRYEIRVLALLRDAWIEAELRTQNGAAPAEWFVFGDDDTWWSDPTMLRELVSQYNYAEDHILGTFSETRGNYEVFGRIAFGGGGIIVSRALLDKMQRRLEECTEKFQGVTGGDGMISNCAALVREVPLETVVEEQLAMRQMDIRGDATGYMTDGSAPYLSLHHWTSWLQLIPGMDGTAAIKLMTAAARAVGGPNFLRRWVFDDGAVTLSLGYAITVHKQALSDDELGRIEWTWDHHEPRKPSRPRLVEGIEKHTYYLSQVEELVPGLHLFRHKCAHPGVFDGIREIDVLWDARSELPSASGPMWPSRWLPGHSVPKVATRSSGPAQSVAEPLVAKAVKRARAFSG